MKYFPFILIIFISIISCNQPTVDLKAEEASIMKTDSTWSALAKQGRRSRLQW